MNQLNKKCVEELSRIAEENGGILQPEVVVGEARNPRSPLHSKFTWENNEAASLWRLEEARRLIRVSVSILQNGSDQPERIWVSLRGDRTAQGGGYRTLVSVLSNKQLRGQLLEEALSDMEYFSQKYSRLKELSEVFLAIKNIRKSK